MTGTAFTEAEEFQQIYGLDVIQIPTNRPVQRVDHEDQIYKTEAGKIKAIVKEVERLHAEGRPVLIGSASIAKNELISAALDKAGLKHETLNAKNNEREAEIIAKAGQEGAITLATNIAGRGTDINARRWRSRKGRAVRRLGAPRIPPHRQPATWSWWSSGRPRRHLLLRVHSG